MLHEAWCDGCGRRLTSDEPIPDPVFCSTCTVPVPDAGFVPMAEVEVRAREQATRYWGAAPESTYFA